MLTIKLIYYEGFGLERVAGRGLMRGKALPQKPTKFRQRARSRIAEQRARERITGDAESARVRRGKSRKRWR